MNLSKIKLFTILSALMVFSVTSFAETDTNEYGEPPSYNNEREYPLPGDYSDRYERRDRYDRYGCQVTFFDKKHFRGRSVTLRGSQYFPNVDFENFIGFEPDSLIVGNSANIWLYDGDGFDDLDYFFRAGANVRKVNNLDSIDSFEVRCM